MTEQKGVPYPEERAAALADAKAEEFRLWEFVNQAHLTLVRARSRAKAASAARRSIEAYHWTHTDTAREDHS